MRLIDADVIKRQMCKKCNDDYSDEPCEPNDCVFVNAINDAPTIDAVPVVRCKDCKHQRKFFHKDKRLKDGGYWMYWCDGNEDPFVSHTVCGYDEDYCSYGEKKEDKP